MVETAPTGLSVAEVAERVARGEVNGGGERTSRTLGEIVRANVFTRFNAILGVLLVVILIIGPIQDALFGLVLVANSLIGIVQEVRAKRTLDQLAVLNAPRAAGRARRGSTRRRGRGGRARRPARAAHRRPGVLPTAVVRASDGPRDRRVAAHRGVATRSTRHPGDEVLSGSFVVAGRGSLPGHRVGADAYARKLATEARRFQLTRSELIDGINLILRFITVGRSSRPRRCSSGASSTGRQRCATRCAATVAGIVGMVPEGLVLLTSIAFGSRP